MNMIRTANRLSNVARAGGYRKWVTRLAHDQWGVKPRTWETRGEVYAYVIRSNWVADCPHCPTTLLVEPGEPFWCPSCLMLGNGGYARKVVMPDSREQIEQLLSKRPDPMTRNWLPGEPVDNLIAENIEHDLEV